jgi:hypothetical protein
MTLMIWHLTVPGRDPGLLPEAGATTASARSAFTEAQRMLGGTLGNESWTCAVNGEAVTYDEFIRLADNASEVAEFVAVAPSGIARIESYCMQ